MSVPIPTRGEYALQLGNNRATASLRAAEVADREGRKRRRITPTNFVPIPSITGDPEPSHGFSLPSSAQPVTWDHLAKWETEDDHIVEDIEEEEYYSDVSDEASDAVDLTTHDGEEENDMPIASAEPAPSRLGNDRVADIINDCIARYTEAWEPGKDETKHKDEAGQTEVPVTYDALQLWIDAGNAEERGNLADQYEEEAQYYRQRLEILCDEIYRNPGHSEAGIRIKCRNLEVTVQMLERAIWLGGIYKLPPDTSSDDADSQEDNNLPQIIDLGTPSASECSEEEGRLLSHIVDTPLSVWSQDNPGLVINSRPLSSDPVVLDTVETPAPTVLVPTPRIARSQAPLGDVPEHASIASVSRWSWPQLEEAQDRKRAVSRAVYEMKSIDREVMRERLQKVGRTNMIREIPACIDMLARGDKRMPGILPQDVPKLVTFTRLFLCWWLCGNYLSQNASAEELEELAICLRQRSPDPSTFCDYVDTILSTTFNLNALNQPTQPSQAEIIEISDDDELPAPLASKHEAKIGNLGSTHKSDPIVLE